jgi:hypothetical protein
LITLAVLTAVSVLIRWGVADLSDWGIDEAANLWLGTELLAGREVPTGLTSSRGIPNLAGAPYLASVFSLLPDLQSVSRALSVFHLAALAVLGLSLWRRAGSPLTIAGVLIFFPALLLASPSLWNQYLTIPLTAFVLTLLLFLVDGRPSPAARAAAVVATVLLLLAQPAFHLAAFVDLVVGGALLVAILYLRPVRISTAVAAPGLVLVAVAVSPLYDPWLVLMTGSQDRGVRWWMVVVVVVIALTIGGVFGHRRLRPMTDRVGRAALGSTLLPWIFFAFIVSCAAAAAVIPFWGAQPGRRLLEAGETSGRLLLVAQAGMVLAVTPIIIGIFGDCRNRCDLSTLIRRHFRCGPGAAALLLIYPLLLVSGRFVLEPSILSRWGRSDLLLPLLPALLAPLLVLGRTARSRAATLATGVWVMLAIAAFGWLNLAGVSERFRAIHRQPVPPSEMREIVDWVAANHIADGGGGGVDLGYNLERGREWITDHACKPANSWYSIGRPYDWLLRRRHGLTNSREGTCDRRGGAGFQLGFRRDGNTPPDMEVVYVTNALEIRMPR